MIVTKRIGALWLTPPQFADVHGVSRQTVYNHIELGKIHVIVIGKYNDRYIDWNKYKAYEFGNDRRRDEK